MRLKTYLLMICFFLTIAEPMKADTPSFVTLKSEKDVKQIIWKKHYSAALKQAKEENKNLLLYFSGSDWCGWCIKFKKNVLDSKDFISYVSDLFVFVKVDFPKKFRLRNSIAKQNASLKNKFQVKSFPTIIIVDHNQQEIDRLGYHSGNGKLFGERVFQTLKNFEIYKESWELFTQKILNDKELEKLYTQARAFNRPQDAHEILEYGLREGLLFFLTEKYRILAKSAQHLSKKGRSIKEQIIQKDPEDLGDYQYHLAVIEFQANLENPQKKSIKFLIAPLTNFLEKFGGKEEKNTWRIQMIISQTLLDQARVEDALQFAHESFASAPKERKKEIENAIKHMHKLLAEKNTPLEAIGKLVK